MAVNWNAVQTTMVSSVAASIIVGSITVIARSALSVDKTVKDATADLVSQAAYVSNAVVIFQKEFVEARKSESAIVDKLEELEEFDAAMFNKFIALAESGHDMSERLYELSDTVKNYSDISELDDEMIAMDGDDGESQPDVAEVWAGSATPNEPEEPEEPNEPEEPEENPPSLPVPEKAVQMPSNQSKIIRRDIPRDDYIQQRLPEINISNLRKR